MSVRTANTIALETHVVSNLEEIGRQIIDINDIETDVQDGPTPKAVAVEYLVTEYVQQHHRQFDVTQAASDGKREIVYTGSNRQ